jgi:hypothetical protein
MWLFNSTLRLGGNMKPSLKLGEISCPTALNNVLHFGFQHVCSMNKCCEFGLFLSL